jgi:hypothetical protein
MTINKHRFAYWLLYLTTCLAYFSSLELEKIFSSETSVKFIILRDIITQKKLLFMLKIINYILFYFILFYFILFFFSFHFILF